MASNVPQFNIVCEGVADYHVIEAVLAAITNNADFVLQRIQPPESLYGGDAGPHGGGWKGVRGWCDATRSKWGSVGKCRHGITGDLLIIHLDADVASEAEFDCARDCPPANATTDQVRELLLGWMGDQALPNWIVFCIPSKDTDAWVLVALYPSDDWALSEVECRLRPAERLLNKPFKLVRRRDGQLHKAASNYAAISHNIANAWTRIKARCGEAKRFESEFRAAW